MIQPNHHCIISDTCIYPWQFYLSRGPSAAPKSLSGSVAASLHPVTIRGKVATCEFNTVSPPPSEAFLLDTFHLEIFLFPHEKFSGGGTLGTTELEGEFGEKAAGKSGPGA